MAKAVIFDVDGTLIDTVDFHAEAWQRAFRKWGKEIPYASIRSQIGKGSDQFIPVFLSETEIAEFGEEMDTWRSELFLSEYVPRVKAFPGVKELFERLRSDGTKIALATSANPNELKQYLDLLEVSDLLDAKASAGDVDRSKPHPDIFQEAVARLEDVQPSETVVIGDTPYDAIAARRAGAHPIGVLCGGFPERELTDAGCIEIFQDPSDLLHRYEEAFSCRTSSNLRLTSDSIIGG